MVAIPAVIEAGAESTFCASLLQPNETLVMTITLISQEKKTDLFQRTSSTEFHSCHQFQVTSLENSFVEHLKLKCLSRIYTISF